MGLSNGPRRAVCTEHYGVKANEMLHPRRHKTLSLSCSCDHPSRVLIESGPRRRRLRISSEVSATSERRNPHSAVRAALHSGRRGLFLTDVSNESASGRTSAVILAIAAPIAHCGRVGRRNVTVVRGRLAASHRAESPDCGPRRGRLGSGSPGS